MMRSVLTDVFSSACPWLALVLCFQYLGKRARFAGGGRRQLLLSGIAAFGVLVVPIQGITAARWLAGISVNYSIPFSGLLAVTVCERAFARPILAPREWTAGWLFGAIGGVTLYPLALGLGSVDPYEWGWRFSPLFVVVAVVTSWLVWKQNRFGWLLLVSVLAFHLHTLESSNYWDYLLDPIYGVVAIGALVGRGLNARSRLQPRPEAP